jgi:hypothetical protein
MVHKWIEEMGYDRDTTEVAITKTDLVVSRIGQGVQGYTLIPAFTPVLVPKSMQDVLKDPANTCGLLAIIGDQAVHVGFRGTHELHVVYRGGKFV